MSYQKILGDLDQVLMGNQKRAEDMSSSSVLGGNIVDLKGEGNAIPKEKKQGDVDVEHPEPSKTDDHMKSVEHQVPDAVAADKRVYDNTLKTEAEKSAKMGNQILADLYALLNKQSMETEKNDEEEKDEEDELYAEESSGNSSDMEEAADVAVDEKARQIAQAIAETADIDAEITPEDEEVLDALGAKTAQDRAVYLLSKQAGMNFATQCAQAGLFNNPMAEQMQKKAAVEQAALQNAYAAQIQQQLALQAFQKQAAAKVHQDMLMKQASAATTEQLLQQAAMQRFGQQAMAGYGLPVNP